MGRFQEQAVCYSPDYWPRGEIDRYKANFGNLVIANAADPSLAFDQAFNFLMENQEWDNREEKDEIIISWEGSGISQPEIRETVFLIMKGLGLFSEDGLKYLLCGCIRRLGCELPKVSIIGADLEARLGEEESEKIFFLSDTSGELFSKLEGDIERVIPDNQERISYMHSEAATELRRFAAIKWYCEKASNKSEKYVSLIRPLFTEVLQSEEYENYKKDKFEYIKNLYLAPAQ